MKHSFREIKRKIYWKSFATSLDYEHYANRRHEWVRRQLQDIPPGLKILDAGAGQMRYKKFCKHLDYSSSDFGKYDGRGNGKAGQSGAWDTSTCDVICDITDMPFPDETFDAVMCTEVLEHVKNPELAIKELIRVLKKNGKIILTAPFGSYTHEAPYHYCTGFNTYWYEYVLPKYGCKIVKMDLHSNFFEMLSMDITAIIPYAKKYCRKELSFFHKLKVILFNRFIEKLEKLDRGSQDVNPGGVFVLGRKG